MPKFLKLNAKYVELLKTLFDEPAGLSTVLERWETSEVELTDAQVRLIHSAIVDRGIPRARELLAESAWSESLRMEAEERLQAWDMLSRLLRASLPG